MSIESLLLPLMSADVFSKLSPQQLKTLALCADRKSFGQGEYIIKAGEDGDKAFLIMHGDVAVLVAGQTEITPEALATSDERFMKRHGIEARFGPGTMLSELAMFTETCHASTIVALNTVHTLVFHRSAIDDLLRVEPELAQSLLAGFSLRLESLAEALREADAELKSAFEADVA